MTPAVVDTVGLANAYQVVCPLALISRISLAG
jgi:hypothetical protein